MSKPPASPPRLDPRLEPPVGAHESTVRLQVPLRDEFASTVRMVVASLAADAGFSVDDIDDLRLAVSEVFSSFHSDDQRSHAATVVDVAAQATADGGIEIRMTSSTGGVAAAVSDLDELATTIIGAAVDVFSNDAGVVTLVKHSDSLG